MSVIRIILTDMWELNCTPQKIKKQFFNFLMSGLWEKLWLLKNGQPKTQIRITVIHEVVRTFASCREHFFYEKFSRCLDTEYWYTLCRANFKFFLTSFLYFWVCQFYRPQNILRNYGKKIHLAIKKMSCYVNKWHFQPIVEPDLLVDL